MKENLSKIYFIYQPLCDNCELKGRTKIGSMPPNDIEGDLPIILGRPLKVS